MSDDVAGGGFGDIPSNDSTERMGNELKLEKVVPDNVTPDDGKTYDNAAGGRPVPGVPS